MIASMQEGSDDARSSPATEEDLLKQLSARIKELRERRKLTKADVAAFAGMQPSQLTRLERGNQEPGLFTLLRLQHALGADTLDALFGELPSEAAGRALTDD